MDFEEEKMIENFNAMGTEPVVIHRIPAAKGGDEDVIEFCNRLEREIPSVSIATLDSEDRPGIRIGNTVTYRAVPGGRELSPFLEAIAAFSGSPMSLSAKGAAELGRLDVPVSVIVFIAAQCPFCPGAVRRLLSLATASPFFHLTVVDAERYSDMAKAQGVNSVPTVILEDRVRWTGSVNAEEIVEMAVNRDPSLISAASLRNLLENGEAARVAAMMMEHGKIFPSLIDLIVHDKWPVRLGAMVVLETIAEEDPELARQAEDPLWSRFEGVEDAVKGDILYLMGETTGDCVRERLYHVLSGPYPEEVREAAAEAMEKLDS